MVASLQTDSSAGSSTSPALMMDTPHSYRREGGREGGRRKEKGGKKRRELSCRERGIYEVLTNFSIESLSAVLVPLRSDHSHILGHMTVT